VASYFLDSSAVVKLYHTEVGSATIQKIFAEPESRILVSRLAVVEVRSAFAGKLRMRAITERDARLSLARFKSDLVAGLIEVFALTEFHYGMAEQLIEKHRTRQRLRTLDSLQLAVALDLREQGLIENFVAADKKLGEVAAAEGLSVLNPDPSLPA
jgi:predicted nucleic acid-binding protein